MEWNDTSPWLWFAFPFCLVILKKFFHMFNDHSCIASSEKHLVKSFAHFLTVFFYCWVLWVLHIVWILIFRQMHILQNFLSFCQLLVIFFAVQKFFSFIQRQDYLCCSCLWLGCLVLNIVNYSKVLKRFTCFLWVSALTLRPLIYFEFIFVQCLLLFSS